MFIKTIHIKNFRLFPATGNFDVELNVPDNKNNGSGLTVFVGENGCGKTALLEAIALPLVSYKADGFSLQDFNDPANSTEIKALSEKVFSFDGTMPNAKYQAKGFLFKANVRSRESHAYLSSEVAGFVWTVGSRF